MAKRNREKSEPAARRASAASEVATPFAPDHLRGLLERHRLGEVKTEAVLEHLAALPFADLGFARLDRHRHLRRGFPEVVFGQGKEVEQVVQLVAAMRKDGSPVLVTRTTAEVYEAVKRRHPEARYHAAARALVVDRGRRTPSGKGVIAVITAGTSDQPVAEEAAVTSEVMGNATERIYDVGVAGLHRLLAERDKLRAARVLIVVAGMEGALPSVVGGLVKAPVIAVPTSTGYGASFGGLAALLAMLNSCASGVTVVNIDNGFGAAFAASAINHLP
jgi:NCAIR mutase (PurE)-related protein